ncbi:hypothetical protein MUO71_01160 [Candidatus Bathyarchaeota archaeon]|nr:hypothetical protein [Candidatus Bathyarchaeota archaeon]
MKWLIAASEEILSGSRKAMTELDLEKVEKFIHSILNAKTRKSLLSVKDEAALLDAPLPCGS